MNQKCKTCFFYDICVKGLPYCNGESYILDVKISDKAEVKVKVKVCSRCKGKGYTTIGLPKDYNKMLDSYECKCNGTGYELNDDTLFHGVSVLQELKSDLKINKNGGYYNEIH